MIESWHSPVVHNVAGALSLQAHRHPDQAAMHYPAGLHQGRIDYRACTYRELDELSDNWARGLQNVGIGRGTRTALMVPPGLDFFAVFFALFKTGAIPVLIDPGIGLSALRTCLGEAAPEAFVGVSRAQAARELLRWSPGSIDKTVTIGPRLGWGGHSAKQVLTDGARGSGNVLEATRPDEIAAILFTSGSTGLPKGVVYRHRHFVAQVRMLGQAFGIEAGDVNLPTFPPFALFDPALGMTSVIPKMDPTRPARANPALLVQAIDRFHVTTVFGSPALLRVIADHVSDTGIHLPSIRRIISAGAAVPIDVIRRLEPALDVEARIFTPYGATECLPVSNVSDLELDREVEELTANGAGICIGRPVAPNHVGIMPISDGPEPFIDDGRMLPRGKTGEIVVQGPTVTDQYWRRDEATRLAKTTDVEGVIWHRMGDIGYFDSDGRLWYCGRKSQRVEIAGTTLFPDQVEAIFNQHPDVARSALVGARLGDETRPVLCVEPARKLGAADRQRVMRELLEMAEGNPLTKSIQTFLFHPAFPVDIRHNAKIGRERMAAWAGNKLK